jgi:tripartite-type tricarboxylate transporter receptor subunit TctC
VNSADFKRRAEDQGAFARTMDPKALDAYVVREIDQWAKVIRTAGITME